MNFHLIRFFLISKCLSRLISCVLLQIQIPLSCPEILLRNVFPFLSSITDLIVVMVLGLINTMLTLEKKVAKQAKKRKSGGIVKL